jgi:hypothetical protein
MTRENAMSDTERDDLIHALTAHRGLLVRTARDLTDEQAATRSTVSALTVGGIIKHVSHTEAMWVKFIVEGTESMPNGSDPKAFEVHARSFTMEPGETLAGIL